MAREAVCLGPQEPQEQVVRGAAERNGGCGEALPCVGQEQEHTETTPGGDRLVDAAAKGYGDVCPWPGDVSSDTE